MGSLDPRNLDMSCHRTMAKQCMPALLAMVGASDACATGACPARAEHQYRGGIHREGTGAMLQALRGGGGQHSLPTQPWLVEGFPPENDPCGKIWETKSWRERIRRRQKAKTALRWSEHDAYGTIYHVGALPSSPPTISQSGTMRARRILSQPNTPKSVTDSVFSFFFHAQMYTQQYQDEIAASQHLVSPAPQHLLSCRVSMHARCHSYTCMSHFACAAAAVLAASAPAFISAICRGVLSRSI